MKQTLFLMLGYPGSGKTTTSHVIQKLTGAEHLWADQQRREMFKTPSYAHDENIQLYSHLNDVADRLLAAGKSVIFDTNFNFYKDRQHLRTIAAKHGVQTLLIWVQADKALAKQRAVVDAHLHSHTRVLGHMPESHFERIAHNLEAPHNDEPYVLVDGTNVTDDYVRTQLRAAGIL